jgi:hypothetical protein
MTTQELLIYTRKQQLGWVLNIENESTEEISVLRKPLRKRSAKPNFGHLWHPRDTHGQASQPQMACFAKWYGPCNSVLRHPRFYQESNHG